MVVASMPCSRKASANPSRQRWRSGLRGLSRVSSKLAALTVRWTQLPAFETRADEGRDLVNMGAIRVERLSTGEPHRRLLGESAARLTITSERGYLGAERVEETAEAAKLRSSAQEY